MDVVDIWTGHRANALRVALRMTNESFAQHLGTAVRTVAKWNAQPDLVPVSELQRALDTALSHASDTEQARFALLVSRSEPTAPSRHASNRGATGGAADLRLANDPAINDALHWLDSRAGWPSGETRRRIRADFHALNPDSLDALARRRSNISGAQRAKALEGYYNVGTSGLYRFYTALCDGVRCTTSVLTKPDWLDLSLPLGQGKDHLTLISDIPSPPQDPLSEPAISAAVRRLAEALAIGTHMTNAPLYRLLHVNASPQRLDGSVGLTNFVDYALTLDLLENELTDALSRGRSAIPGALPLRDVYLPDTRAIIDLERRLCVGGPLALIAIARPPGRRRNTPRDYVFLIQERSAKVLNATGQLAVIPKAFHQPLVDFSDDAQLSATIEREMEEELFGRPEVDSTGPAQRSADPMHISRVSEPMRWLMGHASAEVWRIECVGFGVNAMTGTFEFASLIIINDENWWDIYSGAIEGNWETEGLQRYSSLNRDTFTALVRHPAWSPEGLFAFLQATRRLAQIGGERVRLPPIEPEI